MTMFGKRLRQLREEHQLTLDDFAKIFQTNKSTIWRYENGQRQPTIDFVREVAKYFNVSMDWLAGLTDDRKPQITSSLHEVYSSLPESHKTELLNYANYLKKVYIMGKTAAGKPIEYADPLWEEKDAPVNADFGLIVEGDSMEPLIKDGSTIWVKETPTVENGEIAAVEIDGAVTCKKVYKRNGYLELRSINPKYKPIIINSGNVRILGKVLLEKEAGNS